MKYGLDVSITGAYAHAGLLADLAVLAEEAGWDGFFVQDGLLSADSEALVDPWVALSAIALRTRRLRIGALMTPLAAYRPWQVARQTVSLDHLSRGRLIFGAGLGFQARDFAAVGEDADPRRRAEKLDEGLEILRGLWSGETWSFDCCVIEANPFRHLFEFGKAALFSLGQPGVQILVSTLPEHHDEALSQLVGGLQIEMRLTTLLNRLALFLIELLWLTDKKPGSTGRGHAARDTAFGRQSIRNFKCVSGSIERQS